MCFLLKGWLKETCFFVCFLLKQTAVLSAISICTLHTREGILALTCQWLPAQGGCGICKSTKEKRNIWGGGAAKTGVARIDIKMWFFDSTANSSEIRTCSATHEGTAHRSVSSGMLQIKITLFTFSRRLKPYAGMVLVNMSIKSKSDSMLPVNVFPHRINIFYIIYTIYVLNNLTVG